MYYKGLHYENSADLERLDAIFDALGDDNVSDIKWELRASGTPWDGLTVSAITITVDRDYTAAAAVTIRVDLMASIVTIADKHFCISDADNIAKAAKALYAHRKAVA